MLQRFLAWALVMVMVVGLAVPANALERSDGRIPLTLEAVDADAVTAAPPMQQMSSTQALTDHATDTVRVSIVLEQAPTLEAGYSMQGIAANAAAMDYREGLRRAQSSLQAAIERQALDGQAMDVVWNLTLAGNLISANVPRASVDRIAAMDGVKSVVVETQYSPDVVSIGGEYSPQMAVSGQMTGANAVWLEGYTGAGTRIAVIDTGLDTDHQSFDPAAFDYALAEDAEKADRTVESYGLLDAGEIAEKLTQLNAYRRDGSLQADALYINTKAPFGYNYIDGGTDVTHDRDSQGEHGSHVAGIAAANRYVARDGGFADALETVHVAGNAPDAQILVMKVFGQNGGAFDSDIMAAMEDAIVLGADAVNLSLGSSTAGSAKSPEDEYQRIMENLVECGTVSATSAGNSGHWGENATYGALYADGGVNFDTAGSPGSYTNSFTVASVDNDGLISASMQVGDRSFGYTERTVNSVGTPYSNQPLATLDTTEDGSGTEYEFIWIDGVGQGSDFDGMDLTGKIVFCARGEIYYSEKANAAASRKAAATVVYNTEPGLVNMDMTGYNYPAPAVFISQEDAKAVKDQATAQTTEDGKTYYTGSVTVRGKVTGNYAGSAYQVMSSFSSWGVPGDLSLKPEISAPGGNIYSVNGGVAATDQYELMSGTSMASPQVAGMVALVQQYLREQGIEVAGMTSRALTQSLLMSTATALRDRASGNYYPLLQQGAGLANVSAALRTPTFVTVDGQNDGKVKVELGEDPNRTGTYAFRFQLHNLTDTECAYQLSSDVFTQATETGADDFSYLSILTRTMDATVEFSVDGQSVMEYAGEVANYDFNGDGYVNRADAQLLLDHVTHGAALVANETYADLNGDGQVTTYDVHQFLKLYQGMVVVPAGGSVAVDVSIALTDDEKAKLNAEYPTGAYVEAFVHAAPVATQEGELLPGHSIPVLGYYGSWSEPSMFDVGDYVTHATGDEPRTSYLGNDSMNAVGVVYGDRPTSIYYFGGNPITPDETYLPERNAINLARGDYFYAWQFATVRNAGASRFTAMNTTTGQKLCEDKFFGRMDAAFYYAYYGSWMNAPQIVELDLHPEMELGQYGHMTMSLAPEYYVDDAGNVDWDALAKGTSLEMSFTVDNEAPTIEQVVVNTEKNVMEVTVHDDQYVAGVILYDNTGRRVLKKVGTTADAKPNDTITFEIPLESVNGYRFVIQTADYAANFATYRLKEIIGEPEPLPGLIGFSPVRGDWQKFTWAESPYGGREVLNQDTWSFSKVNVYAATAVGQYAFLSDDMGCFYVAPADDLEDTSYICRLGYVLTDMAYNDVDGMLYGVTEEGLLVSIHKLTGAVTELGQIGGDVGFTNTLACDPNGTFYCAKLGTYEVYAFTLDCVNAPEYLCTADTGAYVTHNLQTMEFDATRQLLCWVARSVYMYNGQPYGSDQYGYYEMNVQDKQVVRTYLAVNYGSPVYGLICPVWEGVDVSWAAPTYEVEGVYFEKDEYEVFAGYTANLRTYVMPWTLADQSLEYSSKDPSIAKVDEQGVVTGVREGETTIVAKSSLNGEKYGECTVVVRSLDVTLEGVLMDDQGATMRFSWDMSGGNSTWHAGAAMDYYAKVVTEIPGEDAFYLLDSRNNIMRKLDLHNGKPVSEETMEYGRYTLWDLAYSNYFSQEGAPKTYAVRESTLLQPQDPMHPTYNSMSPRGAKPFVGVAVGGTERVTYEDYYAGTVETDSEVVYLFDNTCNIWRLNVWDAGDGQYVAYDYLYSVTPTDLHVTFSAGSYAGYSSLVVGSDGALYLSAFTGKYSELYRLVYDELTATYVSTALGTFGRDIWPASLLHVSSNAAAPEAAPVATMRFDSAQQEYLEDAVEESAPTGGLNAILMPDESGAADSQVTFDPEACTVTVPVLASDSTNGLFCVNYDQTLLELEDVRYGDILHSQAAGDGSLTVGYADAAARNGVVAELTFRYVPAKVRQTTSLTLEVRQDGATLPETSETLELTIPALPIAFEDVKPGAWYYDAVEEMAQTGRMIGVSETRFAPQMNLTRGQLATILYRMEGSPDVTGMEHPFKDVSEDRYYSDAVTWASAHGIVRGVTKTKFLPNAAVTREQMAVLLYRYADYKGYDMEVEGDLSRFPDGEKTSEYAEAAMCWAVSVGLFQGIAGGDAIWLKPQNGATRAQAATVLVRFLEKFPA